MIDDDMLGKKVHFKGYAEFKPELYAFDTQVVGRSGQLLYVDHPNGSMREINGIRRLVVWARKEDLIIRTDD